MQLEVLERFVDVKMVQDQIEKLKPQAQSESQARAVKAFEEALERRRAGKPDGRPFFD